MMSLQRLHIACGRGAKRLVRRLCECRCSRLRLALYSSARPARLRHRRRQHGPPIVRAYASLVSRQRFRAMVPCLPCCREDRSRDRARSRAETRPGTLCFSAVWAEGRPAPDGIFDPSVSHCGLKCGSAASRTGRHVKAVAGRCASGRSFDGFSCALRYIPRLWKMICIFLWISAGARPNLRPFRPAALAHLSRSSSVRSCAIWSILGSPMDLAYSRTRKDKSPMPSPILANAHNSL